MTVIGIDSHKDILAGCLIDAACKAVQYREIPNTAEGHAELAVWARTTQATRVAIEGSGNYGRPATEVLLDTGVTVVEVPPQMTAAARRGRRTAAKTDQIDALEIARIAARDDDLPAPRCATGTQDIACIVSYRRELVEERTATVNRLHSDLTRIRCGYHKTISSLTTVKSLNAAERLLRDDKNTQARVARARITRIRSLNQQIKALTTEIGEAVKASGTTLTEIHGIASLAAAEILTETGDPARFATKARYAMANGTAPIEASSGRVKRHRLNRGGNRQLNRIIHTAALCQISHPNTEGRTYYERCLKRGKSKREAMRILKRRIPRPHIQTPTTRQKHKKTTPKLT